MGFSISPFYKVRKTKEGLALKRWFKEKWETSDGKKDYSETKENTFRPTVEVSEETPKLWSQLSKKDIAAAKLQKTNEGRVDRYEQNA
tara:strand:+ start:461 stop:724 length:264 start_codon:yes stop_codon:yes gene_type:complete